MSDLSPQSGPKRTLIKRTAASSATPAVTCRPQERRHSSHRLHPRRSRPLLHELIVRAVGERARTCRWIDGKAAELPIEPDLPQGNGSDKGVARNIVHFECAGVDVAQYEIGRTGCVDRRNARKLPVQAHRADEGRDGCRASPARLAGDDPKAIVRDLMQPFAA
jgi:hypothetical protein